MRLLILMVLCLSAYQSISQELDTLRLDEIEVYGASIFNYSSGAKVLQLRKTESGTLSQSINDQLPIYFKTYGNGQLATVAFRGTSASHTAVLWNGIPVNSPTLGQTDFSLWPNFLVDDVAVQFGSSASLYGSGAIGGSILLESSKPLMDQKSKISILNQIGSFGQFTNGVSTSYSNKKVTGKTRLYHHYIKNDFSYPVKGSDNVIVKQNNAEVKQYGASQDIYIETDQHEIGFHAQFLKNDRQIQPSVANTTGRDKLEDINLRLALNHDMGLTENTTINSTLAYIINDQYYNEDSRVVSQQYSGLSSMELFLGERSSARIGTNINYFIASTDNYDETDWQTDLFASFNFNPFNFWKLSLNLRQSITQNVMPLAPSIGSDLTIYKSYKSQLHWKSQASRAYRLPTLNDLFWQPGGNPDLIAEESLNVESGVDWQYQQDAIKVNVSLNAFRNWVNDWIIWLPNESLIWSPDNIRNVRVSGAEISSSISYSIANHSIDLNSNYSYTQSINESGLSTNDNSVGKQLPYVPEHQFNVGLNWHHKSWLASINNTFTGARYTTDDNSEFNQVDEFNLLDIRLGKEFNLEPIKFNLSIESINVMDIYYENLVNRAMPGRSYLLTLLFNI